MNVVSKCWYRQVPVLLPLLIMCIALPGCGIRKTDTAIVPPLTSPLSRTVIGYGVVNVSYTQLREEPAQSSVSSGYLRRGSVVRILENRVIKSGNHIEQWVLAEGNYTGWLIMEVVDIYDNELQARTAAEFMAQ